MLLLHVPVKVFFYGKVSYNLVVHQDDGYFIFVSLKTFLLEIILQIIDNAFASVLNRLDGVAYFVKIHEFFFMIDVALRFSDKF